jgi:hypothetical protein
MLVKRNFAALDSTTALVNETSLFHEQTNSFELHQNAFPSAASH